MKLGLSSIMLSFFTLFLLGCKKDLLKVQFTDCDNPETILTTSWWNTKRCIETNDGIYFSTVCANSFVPTRPFFKIEKDNSIVQIIKKEDGFCVLDFETSNDGVIWLCLDNEFQDTDGIYKLTGDSNLELTYKCNCNELEIDSNGDLYYSLGRTTPTAWIYKYSVSTDKAELFLSIDIDVPTESSGDFTIDQDDNLWFATGTSIRIRNYKNGRLKNTYTKENTSTIPNLSQSNYSRVNIDSYDNEVWLFLGYPGNLRILKFENNEWEEIKVLEDNNDSSSFASFNISNGSVFIGTNNGLYEYIRKSNEFKYHSENTEMLTEPANTFAHKDIEGNIWLVSNNYSIGETYLKKFSCN